MPRHAEPTFRDRLEYGLFRAVEGAVRLLPWRGALRIGKGIGIVFHLADARHRRVVRENLRRSDLGLNERDVRRLSKACFAHFGSLAMGTLRLLSMTPEDIRRWVRFEGLEHFDQAMAEGKGVVALTGHFGNWELMALALSLEGRTLAVIGRELDNPLLEPHLSGLRGRFGNTVVPKDGAVRESLKILRKGKALGFLLDQDALTMGVFTRFLGNWASTFSAAGMLATRFDLPMLPIFNRVHEDGSLTVKIYPPFHLARTGQPERDAWAATQLMTRCIDAEVRRDPARWFWMHRRFKTQPGQPGCQTLPPETWFEPLQALRVGAEAERG